MVDASQERDLDDAAEEADADRRQAERDPEHQRMLGQRLYQRDQQIGADHVEAAVRQVHDARHAEDQRHPHRDEEEEHRHRQPAHHLDDDERAVGDPGKQAGQEVHTPLLLLLGRRGRPELLHLVTAPRDVLALELLDIGGDRLALRVELHDADPLGR